MSLQERLRAGVDAALKPCPTCGTKAGSMRDLAKTIGTSPSTLCRFLAGKDCSGDALDKIDAYLERTKR